MMEYFASYHEVEALNHFNTTDVTMGNPRTLHKALQATCRTSCQRPEDAFAVKRKEDRTIVENEFHEVLAGGTRVRHLVGGRKVALIEKCLSASGLPLCVDCGR